MSIATEITRLNNAKASIKSAIEAKGVEVPQDAKIDIYADYIAQIPQGGGTEYEPICFTSLEDGNTFQLNRYFISLEDGNISQLNREISISIDGKQTWQTLAANTNSPVINTGEKIYFKAAENATPFSGTTSDYYQFTTAKTCKVSGHPYSLYAKGSSYFFSNLFKGTKIVNASGLTLDADTVPAKCYFNMFFNCTSLTIAPELPATNLDNRCYCQMFKGCTSLVTAPELPATTLANECYGSMFYGCTSLTTAPELPATTLANGCYSFMFEECTKLTSAPVLPATTLITLCYRSMFYGCLKLKYIKCLATDISASDCISGWVTKVASTGTFVKNPSMSSWPTGYSGVPTGWTVVNYNA